MSRGIDLFIFSIHQQFCSSAHSYKKVFDGNMTESYASSIIRSCGSQLMPQLTNNEGLENGSWITVILCYPIDTSPYNSFNSFKTIDNSFTNSDSRDGEPSQAMCSTVCPSPCPSPSSRPSSPSLCSQSSIGFESAFCRQSSPDPTDIGIIAFNSRRILHSPPIGKMVLLNVRHSCTRSWNS